jgi:hypothetical protein
MIVIRDERDEGDPGTCANCGERKDRTRPVEEFSWLSGASRGFRQICFCCFGPRVFWRANAGGRLYETPVRLLRR